MKKIIPYIISALVISIVYYFLCLTPSTQKTQNTLIIGTSADYPPYAQIDLNTGKIVGFEIDVIQEIAQRLHKKLIIKDMPFNSLILELMAGQIDIIAAGLSPSPERAKAVLFSIPYIDNDDLVIVSSKDTPPITNIADLHGKFIAVNTGYTSDTYLSQFPEINLIRLKSTADGVMALQAKSVDAFATSKSSFDIFINKQQENHPYQYFNLPASADACALAFEKNNQALQQQINPVIDAMMTDGTIEKFKKKWSLS